VADEPAAGTATGRPRYEGYLDAVGPEMIAGWARNIDDAGQSVELDILIDGRHFARSTADSFSTALQGAGIGTGRHAFATRVPVALFDGQPHQVAVRIAGTGIDLRQSPALLELPSIARLGPLIAQSLAAEPWIIDSVSLEGSELTLAGWAIPPLDRPAAAGFLLNGRDFDSVDWPRPRSDIHQLYFCHPHASRTGFELRAELSNILASDATELVMRYARIPGGEAIHPRQDYYFPLRRRSDIPLPDASRRKRVSGNTDPLLFVLGGYTLLRKLELLLTERYATSIDEIGRILDWGCGCGRLLRFLVERVPRPGAIFGADVDADNVAWCRTNLPSATTCTTRLLPPSPFASGQFDLIIGNSVFTHLGEETQIAWLEELSRILAAGGIAMVSVQTITDLSRETFHSAAYDRLLQNGFISEKIDDALSGVIADGKYYRSAFHTHDYIRSVWSKYFAIEDIIPQFSNNMQDFVLMRKRP
jgi:SAM-dependent methyltransferase